MKESIPYPPGLNCALGLRGTTALGGIEDNTFFYGYSLEWAAFSGEAPCFGASAYENAAIGFSISRTIE